MRRLAVVLGGLAGVLWVAAPAAAFAHDRVRNPYLHAVLDVLSLAVVTAPLWTAYLWRGARRGPLLALVAVVQLPVAVIAFVPATGLATRLASGLTALALTAISLCYVRWFATSPATAHAPEPR